MKLHFKVRGHDYHVQVNNYHDISIPLKFNGEQPNMYDIDHAVSQAYQKDGFVGDTRKGGGCNFEEISMIPHCNGTHTECIGHITHKRYSIQEQLVDSFIPATLISVEPVKAFDHEEGYMPVKNSEDTFITRKQLKKALESSEEGFQKAVLIRTLPNDQSKKKRRYSIEKPAFFSIEAMAFLSEIGVDHLLVDLPSIDRSSDEGKLSAHHVFWNMEFESHETGAASKVHKTITEMIYVPDEIKDGNYLLNLQIAPFMSDASPSRPLIYPLQKILNSIET